MKQAAAGDMIGEPKAVSKKAFAEMMSITQGRVSQLIKKGLPVEPDGRIDVARGKLWIQANVSPIRSGAQSKQAALPFAAQLDAAGEQARYAKERADNMELRNKQIRRELVSAAEVEKVWAGEWRYLRSAILAAPTRIRQNLPHLSREDVDEINAILRTILREFANG